MSSLPLSLPLGYVFTGVCLFNFWGGAGGGYPHLLRRRYPHQVLTGGRYPIQPDGERVPPSLGVPPSFPIGGGGTPLSRDFYVAGSMPLAFTQEDFLVVNYLSTSRITCEALNRLVIVITIVAQGILLAGSFTLIECEKYFFLC